MVVYDDKTGDQQVHSYHFYHRDKYQIESAKTPVASTSVGEGFDHEDQAKFEDYTSTFTISMTDTLPSLDRLAFDGVKLLLFQAKILSPKGRAISRDGARGFGSKNYQCWHGNQICVKGIL
ncbi:hypothetical protein CLAIMM_05803 [Cladophialophora immunda]|nr:hypothetical protein CLAIMM_05803 [Cladophialophora immunda]